MLWLLLMTVCLNDALAKSGMLRGSEEKRENAVCLTEERCWQKFQDMDLGGYFYVNNWPTKGCFSKNNVVYFGMGGTVDEMTETNLPGIQERIWCDNETEAPAAKPSKQPMANPTAKSVTDSPTKQPTQKPVTDTPSKKPTLKPVTYSSSIEPTLKPVTDRPTKMTANARLDSPTKQPTLKPFTESPTKQPTKKLKSEPTVELILAEDYTEVSTEEVDDVTEFVTDSPPKNPSAKPVTDSPTKLPTVKLVTDSPSKQTAAAQSGTDNPHQNHDAMPAIDSPTMQHTVDQVTHSPTKKPAQKQPIAAAPAVIDSPNDSPTATPLIDSTTTEAPSKGGEDSASNDDGSFLMYITPMPTLQPFTPKPIGSPAELTIDAHSKGPEVTTSSSTSVPTTSPHVKITQTPMKSPEMLMETSLSSLSSTTKSPSIAPIASSTSTVHETVSPTTSSRSPSAIAAPPTTFPEPSASPLSNNSKKQGAAEEKGDREDDDKKDKDKKESDKKQQGSGKEQGGEVAETGVEEEERGESFENYLAKSTTREEESPPAGNKLWVVGIIGGVVTLFVVMYAAVKVRRRINAQQQEDFNIRSEGINSLVIENPDLAEIPGFNMSYEGSI